MAYLRNYVRHKLLPRFTIAQRKALIELITTMAETNRQLDSQIVNFLHTQPTKGILNRQAFVHLPHKVALEVLASWLRHQGIRNFDRKALERLVVAAKTAKPGTTADVLQGYQLKIGRDTLALVA
jgi:hypothetical protein